MAPLGNFVRLHPLHTNELPDHPALYSLINGPKGRQPSNGNTPTNGSVTRPNLRQFIIHVLDEAFNFIEHTVPNTFNSRGTRRAPPAEHPVELMSKTYSRREISRVPWQNPYMPRQWSGNQDKAGETWFARRSRHSNQSEEGTATFSEFDEGLRQHHSQHEQDYTPDVYDHYEVLNWDELIQTDVSKNGQLQGTTGVYTEVQMGSKSV